MPVEPLTVTTRDGVTLEAELATAPDGELARAGIVLCHPHPLHGGTMRSIVISALFAHCRRACITCPWFNFRGVEESGGFARWRRRTPDAVAAIEELAARLPPRAPLVLAGWSFGADVALSVHDPRLAAWLAIACPLHYVRDEDVLARDPRPKLLALAQHDEVRAADEVAALAASWSNTTVEIVRGASHFFVGATDKLVVLARDFVSRVAGEVAG
jgi:alpha/beta superfamily hydrolase